MNFNNHENNPVYENEMHTMLCIQPLGKNLPQKCAKPPKISKALCIIIHGHISKMPGSVDQEITITKTNDKMCKKCSRK